MSPLSVDSYRIVNFPIDSKTHRNLGYVFIAFNNNSALFRFYSQVRESVTSEG